MRIIGVCPDGVVWETEGGVRVVMSLPPEKTLIGTRLPPDEVFGACYVVRVERYDGFEWKEVDSR